MRQLTHRLPMHETVKSFVHSDDKVFGEMPYYNWCVEESERINRIMRSEKVRQNTVVKTEGGDCWIETTEALGKTTQELDLEALEAKRAALGVQI